MQSRELSAISRQPKSQRQVDEAYFVLSFSADFPKSSESLVELTENAGCSGFHKLRVRANITARKLNIHAL
jgi:hypothetical protein